MTASASGALTSTHFPGPRAAPTVHWHDRLPERIDGVVLCNEVLDAMPVQLLRWDGERWFERGVCSK